MVDFFVSYAEPDRDWAVWIAWQLQEEGYQIVLQDWDFSPGSNFVVNMQSALTQAERVVAVLSAKYIDRRFPKAEWAAAFANDPTGEARKLLPVRIEDFRPTGIFSSIVYVDLVGRQEEQARDILLSGIKRAINGRTPPLRPPQFPGTVAPDIKPKPGFPGRRLTNNDSSGKHLRRFIHSKVTTEGMLDANVFINPYRAFFDSTDTYADEPHQEVHCFLWLPRTEVIRSSQLEPLTPTAAICTVEPHAVLSRLKTLMGPDKILSLDYPPRRLRNEEKALLFPAIGDSLKGCFVFAVIFPDLVLGLDRSRSEDIAYQAMINLLFLPLLGMHKRLGFQRFNAHFFNVGEKDSSLLALAKKAAKSCYSKKDSVSVSLSGSDPCADAMGKIGRLFAWAVGHYYNSEDKRWLTELEDLFTD